MAFIYKNVSYTYSPGTVYATKALNNINLTINDNEFIGIIGHTGSGKSTLVQTMNGLIRATSGDILYNGQSIYASSFDMRDLRTQVGLVFQYPENQLFEITVYEDICFGPKNQGLSEKDISLRALEAIREVKISDKCVDMSPFSLSGGEKRKAAIAGVLAMKPITLILDEPTAGLDPKGRDEILSLLKELHEKKGITVILVSHSMEDVAQYVDRIICMDNGYIKYDASPKEVFKHKKELEEMGLSLPSVTYFMNDLKREGFDVSDDVITVKEAKDEILRCFGV